MSVSEFRPVRFCCVAIFVCAKTPLRVLGMLLLAVVAALACGWSYISDHSVRFNSYRSGRAFYRLPPLPIQFDAKTGKDRTVRDTDAENETPYGYGQGESPNEDGPDEIWAAARAAALDENDLVKATQLLRKYLVLTEYPSLYRETDTAATQRFRNSTYDLLDAGAAMNQGSSFENVKEYFYARYSFDNWGTAGDGEAIEREHSDKNLRDNWAYLRAAVLTKDPDLAPAIEAFQSFVVEFPASEKREAALFMVAKLTMEQSHSFTAKGCNSWGEIEETDYFSPPETVATEPKLTCQDEAWHSAIKDFEQFIRKYPNGRYANDARGWLGFLYRHGEEPAEALAEYYRLLGNPTDRHARLEAKRSLQLMGHKWNDATLDKLERLIAGDVNAAMAYSYHRIYNFATDDTFEESYGGYEEGEEKNKEAARINELHATGQHELERMARFATMMMKRYPRAPVSGGFVLRVAEAQLELQDFHRALELSTKASSLGVSGDTRAQALWVRGSAEHALKNLRAARDTFNQLITEFPDDKLTEGARRLLALTAEDQNDLETALEQYLVLKYDYDVAYFVDVLLPTNRLAKFVSSHKQIPEYNQLLYGLAVRYMRDGSWAKARTAYQSVRTKPGTPTNSFLDYNGERRVGTPKGQDWNDDGQSDVKSSWVAQDLLTIDEMANLEQAIDQANGDEGKAEAMYQLASYQFDATPVLFYNPGAWHGMRYSLLSDLWNDSSMRLPNESQVLFDHFQSHDTLARSIPIYLKIVQLYPNTKAAKDALYSAAVAHQRLSDLNPFWRDIYERGLFAGPRKVTYSDVRGLFPRYQLPLGTYGWRPSTRTVNGGPGWAAAPKPPPKLTRPQKAEKIVKEWTGVIEEKLRPGIGYVVASYVSLVRACVYCMLIAIGLLLVSYTGLLGLHFRNLRSSQAQPELSLIAASDENLPPSDSRIDKIIDTRDGPTAPP